jgi:hypothetical protein
MMLDSGTYSFGTDEMTAQRFKNILIAAVNLNEIEWAEKFVNQYAEKVQIEYRESMWFYSRALISFRRKDFLQSLSDINKVKNDYFVLKMDIKSWTLKNYFELGYIEQSISYIDSYRHFLSKNNSLSEYFKERHLNFLKLTSDLLKLKSAPDFNILQRINKEFTNTNNIVHKDWIEEKIKELEL